MRSGQYSLLGVLRHVAAQLAMGHYWAFSKMSVVEIWELWGIILESYKIEKNNSKMLLDKTMQAQISLVNSSPSWRDLKNAQTKKSPITPMRSGKGAILGVIKPQRRPNLQPLRVVLETGS
ncbi:hypothetical protein Hanom_Chr15g01369421 [Helianthus anomalus]